MIILKETEIRKNKMDIFDSFVIHDFLVTLVAFYFLSGWIIVPITAMSNENFTMGKLFVYCIFLPISIVMGIIVLICILGVAFFNLPFMKKDVFQ